MKQLLVIAGLGLAVAGCMTPYGWSEAPLDDRYHAARAPVGWWGRDVASVDVFYGSLVGHGNWGVHPRYGRVFLPGGIGSGWQPYSRGHWRQDPRFGRMWVSSEPWGWATYHYGRWGRDPRFGWFWVPDTRFGPGWVDWRQGGGFASWSPLPPMGWDRWGNGWGNDWWVHAPGAWAWRPGLYSHIRPGRHDWNRRYPGRDSPGRDSVVDRTPPRSPVRIPPSSMPRTTADGQQTAPAWTGRTGDGRQWDGRQGNGRRWEGRGQDGGRWEGRQENGRRWDGRGGEGRPAAMGQERPAAPQAVAPTGAIPSGGNPVAGYVRNRLQQVPRARDAQQRQSATQQPRAEAPIAPQAERQSAPTRSRGDGGGRPRFGSPRSESARRPND